MRYFEIFAAESFKFVIAKNYKYSEKSKPKFKPRNAFNPNNEEANYYK